MPFDNPEVLFVMAVASEYGPCLQRRISPLLIGVGPVEAAVNLTAYLGRAAEARRLPDLVISLGSAGSQRLPQCGIYQVSAISYRDMDVSVLGYERGCNPQLDLPAEVPLDCPAATLPRATLSTGADMVSGAGYARTGTDMVDMETFAVWRACAKFGLPLVGLRGISDGQAELRHVADWREYLDIIDEKLSYALEQIEHALGGWRFHSLIPSSPLPEPS